MFLHIISLGISPPSLTWSSVYRPSVALEGSTVLCCSGEPSISYAFPHPTYDDTFKLAPVLEDLYSFDAD